MALETIYKHFGIFLGAEICCIALEIPVFAVDRRLDMQKGTIYLFSFSKIDTITYIEAQEYLSQ